MRLVFAVASVACVAGLSSAAAQPAPRIVFAGDRSTTRAGEIYSFDLATGKTHDISRSLAQDSGPAVSPDGRWIAFGSMRSGTLGLYVARLDGSQLTFVKRFHTGLTQLVVRWSPEGTRLAAVSTCCSREDELWIGSVSGVGTTRWDAEGFNDAAWSDDGRYYAYAGHYPLVADLTVLDVVDASGHLAWRRNAQQLRDLGWSADGRLAWMTGTQAHLATAAGTRLPGFPAVGLAWSPDGQVLAAVRTHGIELRASGTGAPRTVFRPTTPRGLISGIRWLGADHVVVTPADADGELRVDVRTGKAVTVGYEDVVGVVSPDARLLLSDYWPGSTYRPRALRVGALLGSSSRVVAQTRDCSDDHAEPFDHFQFVPGTRMVVYLADCGDPTADLYSIRADGSGIRQLTYTAAHEQTPALSPDGSRIAYVRSVSIGHGCEGCPSSLWVMNADGSHPHRLTNPTVKNSIGDWDANPSWSPDGKSIVFDRAGASSWLGLFVIGVDGGTASSLHIAGARRAVWGPHRIAYSGELGAIWTALPDGTDRRLVAPRHTCDNECFYAWTQRGLVYATVKVHVTHSTLAIRGGGSARRVQLPFRPADVAWADGGATLLVTAPTYGSGPGSQWSSEGDLYRVDQNGTVTRLTNGLGTISIAG